MSTDLVSLVRPPKNTHSLFYFLCVLFCGLYVVRDIIGIKFSYYVIYVLAATIVFAVSKEEAICFFLAISSFTEAGFNGAFCTMFFVCILFRFAMDLKSIRLHSLLLVLMVVLEISHSLMSTAVGIGDLLTYVMVLCALLIVQQYPYEKINKPLIINTFIAFSLFFVIAIIVTMSIEYGSFLDVIDVGFRTDEYTEIRDLDGLSANQNYVTQLCSLNICLCVLMLSKKYYKPPYIIALTVFLICGLLTISKMFIVFLVLLALYVSFFSLSRNFLKGLGVIVIFVALGAILMSLFGETLIQYVIERFESGDLTTGRIDIVKDLLVYMNENPLMYFVGVGILPVHYVLDQAIHSSVFEILGGWGIFGLVMAIAYMVMLIKHAVVNARNEKCEINGYNWLPLLLLLGYTLAGMLFGQPFTLVQMMVCIFAMQIKEKNQDVIQHNNARI